MPRTKINKRVKELQVEEGKILKMAETGKMDVEKAEKEMVKIQLEIFNIKLSDAGVKDEEMIKKLMKAFEITNEEDGILAELETAEDIDDSGDINTIPEVLNIADKHKELASQLTEMQKKRDRLLKSIPEDILEKLGMQRLY